MGFLVERLSSPVSSKGQVVIPGKIRQKLEITTGDRIEFIVKNDVVIMQKEHERVCPVCKGSMLINQLECFLCEAAGMLNTNTTFLREIEKLIKYSISLNLFGDREEDLDGAISDFVKVKIHSIRYPAEAIEWYQEYLQAKVIEEHFSSGFVTTADFEKIAKSFSSINIRNLVIKQLPSVKKLTELILIEYNQ